MNESMPCEHRIGQTVLLTLVVRNEDLATPDVPRFDLSNWDW